MSSFIKITSSCAHFIFGSRSETKAGHLKNGTSYGAEGVEGYMKNGHGPDGARFIDMHLDKFLSRSKDKKVLDIGCGAGPWSIRAAEHGAKKVVGFDIQEHMINQGKRIVKSKKLTDRVELSVGDAANMIYQSSSFQQAMSVCVACNLPNQNNIFSKHFQELARVLATGGEALVVAPTSLDTLFTIKHTNKPLIHETISKIRDQLGINPTTEQVAKALEQLPEILSGTFALDPEGKFFLVTDEIQLTEGQVIWRKLPKVTVPNFYHSDAAYVEQFKKNNLKITRVVRDHFQNTEERALYNQQNPLYPPLGKSYTEHAPFVLYYVTKA